MSNQWRFVLAAYTVTWVVLVGYAAYVELQWRRLGRGTERGET